MRASVARWALEERSARYRLGAFELLEERWSRPDGVRSRSPILRAPSFACVVPVTEEREVVLVRNRHPSPGLGLLELPGGRLERGETPRSGARRELREETGWEARRLTRVGRYYPVPHWSTMQGHLFVGDRLVPGIATPDPGESVFPVRLPVEEVYRRLRRGRFLGGSTLVGLHLAEPVLRDRGWLPSRAPETNIK